MKTRGRAAHRSQQDLRLPRIVFVRLAITRVAGVVSGSIMLLVAEMVSRLALQGSFGDGLRELLQQPVEAFHSGGRVVVLRVVRLRVRV